MSATVFDVDDLCDSFDPWGELHDLKEKYPNLRVTLFAIPGRCSDELLARYRALDWVELGVHGYHHAPRECLVWGFEEAMDKLEELESQGWDKLFKAPNWQLGEEAYNALHFRGWKVADHAVFAWRSMRTPVDRYTYNVPGSDIVSIHGHTWETCGNGPSAWGDLLSGSEGAEFKFVSEVCRPVDWGWDLPEVQSRVNATEGDRHANNIVHTRIDQLMAKEGPVTVADFGGWDGGAISKCTRPDLCTLVEGYPPVTIRANDAGVKAICADLRRLPIPDNAFDWGICSHTLEHVEEIQDAWSEIRRVCSQGVIVVLPLQTQEEFDEFPDHFHMADAEGWARMLGFEILEILPGKEVVGVWRA